jgi:hypothetical protein
MGSRLGAQVRLHDDDDVQRLRELLMEQLHLVEAGLHVSLDSGGFEGRQREGMVRDLGTILALGTPSGVGAGVGEVERRITSELGNQM